MSFASALPVADPPAAGGALSEAAPRTGRLLLGLVERMMQTGMAMARCVNRIARQRLAGQDLARLGPAKFNPTLAGSLVLEAVSWTAALRERLSVLTGPSRLAPDLSRAEPAMERAPQARAVPTMDLLPEGVAEPTDGNWHNWRELARPLRMGPGGVAVATGLITGMSNREVVAGICDRLRRAAAELGAEADVGRIAALEAAARALCPDLDAAAAGAPAAKPDEPPDEPPEEAASGSDGGAPPDKPPPAPD